MSKKVIKAIWNVLENAAQYAMDEEKKDAEKGINSNFACLNAFLHQVNAFVALADTMGMGELGNEFYNWGDTKRIEIERAINELR